MTYCISLKPTRLVLQECHNNLLMQRVENTNDCELKMLMNPSATPKGECDIRVKPNSEEAWIFLKYQNQWLFSGFKETSGL